MFYKEDSLYSVIIDGSTMQLAELIANHYEITVEAAVGALVIKGAEALRLAVEAENVAKRTAA